MKVVAVNVRGYRIGASHHNAKLADDEVDLILFLRDAGLSYRAIAAKFDDDKTISFSQVRKVCKGQIRAQTPDRYRTQGAPKPPPQSSPGNIRKAADGGIAACRGCGLTVPKGKLLRTNGMWMCGACAAKQEKKGTASDAARESRRKGKLPDKTSLERLYQRIAPAVFDK